MHDVSDGLASLGLGMLYLECCWLILTAYDLVLLDIGMVRIEYTACVENVHDAVRFAGLRLRGGTTTRRPQARSWRPHIHARARGGHNIFTSVLVELWWMCDKGLTNVVDLYVQNWPSCHHAQDAWLRIDGQSSAKCAKCQVAISTVYTTHNAFYDH